jgi:hypothetical protein
MEPEKKIVDQDISLFIPSVYSNITKDTIVKTFRKSQIGEVRDIVFSRKDGTKNQAYIFVTWFETPEALDFQDVIARDGRCKMFYSSSTDRQYWVVVRNDRIKFQKHYSTLPAATDSPAASLPTPDSSVKAAPKTSLSSTVEPMSRMPHEEWEGMRAHMEFIESSTSREMVNMQYALANLYDRMCRMEAHLLMGSNREPRSY